MTSMFRRSDGPAETSPSLPALVNDVRVGVGWGGLHYVREACRNCHCSRVVQRTAPATTALFIHVLCQLR